ncbi:MAG: diguanylate cyclase [Candidatus Zixiibacteriota bacterium]|nr:MAG: diguanylate cyclase [candidate division Zixibacteria bacterium]
MQRFFQSNNMAVHYFDAFEELVTICQRFPIDIIMIGSRGSGVREVELIRSIKDNVFLRIVPVVMFHPQPDENIVVAAYQAGAEDFVYGDWRDKLVQVRIKRVIERSRRDLSINPSTHLPGPGVIESEVARQISMGAQFAVCYADLDNFKAYNDYYGYYYGDRVIHLTSRVIKDVVFDLCREGFVGHIAGDDFIFVIPPGEVDRICGQIIRTFDVLIPWRYANADREQGFIRTVNRRGQVEEYPILTISIAVLINENGEFSHIGEMARMLADLKTATKAKSGSNYMIERRRKY